MMLHPCSRLFAVVLWMSCPTLVAAGGYQIGCAKTDITGPALGVQLAGYVNEGNFKDGQLSEGIHFRQWSRAFVVADPQSGKRFAFVSADLMCITHAIHLSVVEHLQSRLGDLYTIDNTIVSATHTHAAPGGFMIFDPGSPIGIPFLKQYYDVIVGGIVESIVKAHENLRAGEITINQGIVQGGGANRSTTAYLNNPASERARYDADTDKQMTLLKFTVAGQAIGSINWFAVHPTGMTYTNKLISGDIKGYGSYLLESQLGNRDGQFVAACAQSNCGDVTPNLNLDQTGPGRNEFDKTRIITERQVATALKIFAAANETLNGPMDYRQAFIDFAYRPVDEKFTSQPNCRTCPSAVGYAAMAGSTEDGGTHSLFREGMVQRNLLIDQLAKRAFGVEPPSKECRECHGNKAILVASGETKPYPAQSQILPITLVRIGQLAILAVPAEFTTMSGRRLRATVAEALGDSVQYVVVAGYSNDYASYVTTKEEYDTQQYEGGQTLFGPWTLAAYQQEFARLATAMRQGTQVDKGPMPRDMRTVAIATELGSSIDFTGYELGIALSEPKPRYSAGNEVEIKFASAHPQDTYPQKDSFLSIQRREGEQWSAVATDDDWQTRCRWETDPDNPQKLTLRVIWEIPEETPAGTYRIGHVGASVDDAGRRNAFSGYSKAFEVR